jgi:hypothetical protein
LEGWSAIALLAALSASAVWGNADWGKSPAKVAKSADAAVSSGEGSDEILDTTKSVGAVGHRQWGPFRFRSLYYFENDRLSLVTLNLEGPGDTDCSDLKRELTKYLGAPLHEEQAHSMNDTVWRDKGSGNWVELTVSGASPCPLTLTPASDPPRTVSDKTSR